MEENSNHEKIKLFFKIAGVVILITGITCSIIGFIDFFSSISNLE